MKKYYLVFTRDFDQWVNEMTRQVFLHDLPKIFGRGLSDQITHYTGRTFEWWRSVDDMQKLKDCVIHKKLDDYIFQPSTQRAFLFDVRAVRRLLSQSPAKIQNHQEYLKLLKNLYIKMYPFYVLAVFLPGVWREDFLKLHGSKGKVVLGQIFKSREGSEGLLKEITNYLRRWLSPKLYELGYPVSFSKLLSVSEVEKLIIKNTLPTAKVLINRAKGFASIGNKIIPTTDFYKTLKSQGVVPVKTTVQFEGELSGTVAFRSKPVMGKIKIVLNAEEVRDFKRGMVLVTSMTAPEYLPIMKKATAIITDEGGITCHAAIVARELKKPCIIGTKIATKVFKDGDLVEVDANSGDIRKI